MVQVLQVQIELARLALVGERGEVRELRHRAGLGNTRCDRRRPALFLLFCVMRLHEVE